MAELSCTYLGLNLQSPLIVSSSGLTDSLEKIMKLQDLGAGAVVLKSLFEEEIGYEEGHILDLNPLFCNEADESGKFIFNKNSVKNYLHFIEEAKKKIAIPVIASLNCITKGKWSNAVQSIESAGADAIELDIFFFPDDKTFKAEDYEKAYFDVVLEVAFIANIPVVVKLSPYFTNLLYIIDQVLLKGAKGIVLFNRNFQPDIDISALELKCNENYSSPSEIYQSLRWINIISRHFKFIDIAASNGVHDSDAIIKLLLSGANAIIICSVLYRQGIGYISNLLKGLSDWMDNTGFKKIEHFQGQVNYSNIQNPLFFERSNFIKYFK